MIKLTLGIGFFAMVAASVVQVEHLFRPPFIPVATILLAFAPISCLPPISPYLRSLPTG